MRLLLDTCAAIWFFAGDDRLRPALVEVLTDPVHELFLSDVSVLEVVIKHQLGKFPLRHAPSRLLPMLMVKHGVDPLPLTTKAIFGLEALPLHHRDPFDRLLVAQARAERLTLVTPDPKIRCYDVPVHWEAA